MSLVQSMSSVDTHCGGTGRDNGQRQEVKSPSGLRRSYDGDDHFTHREEQGGDGSATFHVDHGEEAGEVAFSGSSKEQSTRDDSVVVVQHATIATS